MNTPILLITFNRPTHTKRVLERILEASPRDLYIFQDGAREGNAADVQKCQEVRDVIDELTVHCASCTIHHNYSDVNLGCGPGPMTGINWFFENEEQGIIIEDDALPHPDFFPYCEELLNKYASQEDVATIASMNIDNHTWGDGSYYFSMGNRNLCAWATWKRAWQSMNLLLPQVSYKGLNDTLRLYGCDLKEREYWCDRLLEIHKDGANGASWDMQFCIINWLKQTKCIVPNVNLSTNIGFDNCATHGTNQDDLLSNNSVLPIMPLIHPTSFKIQSQADREYHRKYFQPWEYGWKGLMRLPYRINKRLKRLVGHEGPWIKK